MTQLCFTACCYCNEFQSYYYFWHNSNSNSSNYWANWLQCKLQEMIYANLHPCGSAETLQFLKFASAPMWVKIIQCLPLLISCGCCWLWGRNLDPSFFLSSNQYSLDNVEHLDVFLFNPFEAHCQVHQGLEINVIQPVKGFYFVSGEMQ